MLDDEKQLLERLDIPTVVRCETRVAPSLSCKETARFSTRCFACMAFTVYCPEHIRDLVSAVNNGGAKARCGGCGRVASKIGELFVVGPLG